MVRFPSPLRFQSADAAVSRDDGDGEFGFPVLLRAAGRPALVVGATPAAEAKARLIGEAGIAIRQFDPRAGTSGAGAPGAADFQDAVFAVVATGDETLDRAFAERARAHGLPVNVVDRPALSDFTVPAIVRRGAVSVAIATGGRSPVLAQRVRALIEGLLPARLGDLAALAGAHAAEARARLSSPSARRRFWNALFDGPAGALALDGRSAAAVPHLEALLDEHENDQHESDQHENSVAARRGRVALVGAGPGDPDLLTLKALQALQDADVIVHDRLVPEAILARARQEAERIAVGKRPGGAGWRQDEINRLLCRLAQEGKRVVRLKGGDPAVFSRGGEEAAALRAAGIDCTLVPGITAASAAAAAAGVTLSRRGRAQAITLVTAHPGDGEPEPDWSADAAQKGTLCIYMGVARAAETARKLMAEGRPADTPVLVVERASLPDERRLLTRLDHLGKRLSDESVRAPAMLLIGEAIAEARVDDIAEARVDEIAEARVDEIAEARVDEIAEARVDDIAEARVETTPDVRAGEFRADRLPVSVL